VIVAEGLVGVAGMDGGEGKNVEEEEEEEEEGEVEGDDKERDKGFDDSAGDLEGEVLSASEDNNNWIREVPSYVGKISTLPPKIIDPMVSTYGLGDVCVVEMGRVKLSESKIHSFDFAIMCWWSGCCVLHG
jgi:hypothetical protein